VFQPVLICDATPENLETPAYQEFLRRAVGDSLVLVLRTYGRLSAEAHIRLASIFGPVQNSLAGVDEPAPQSSLVQTIERNEPANRTATRHASSYYWHTDRSFLSNPAFITLLNMWRLPARGGDIYFLNTRAAFTTLSESEKQRLRRSRARHSYSYYHNMLQPDHFDASIKRFAKEEHPDVWHPLVVQDPVNGSEAIYFSELCVTDIELAVATLETAPTILGVSEKLYASDFVYRHSWQEGDLLIWNNLATMHRSEPSVGLRQLRRVVTDCWRPINEVSTS
jgi:alpha-ketoglutarate-dependent taurine dioxygenase